MATTSAAAKAAAPLDAKILARLRDVCARWPAVVETSAWGHPNWRVAARRPMFLAYEGAGRGMVCWNVDPETRSALEGDSRFHLPPHAGRTWIALRLGARIDWGEIEHLAGLAYAYTARPRPSRSRAKR
jgi:hypothetical protein